MDCQLADNNPGNALNLLDKLVADYPARAGRFYHVAGRRYQWMHQYGDAAKALRQAVDKLKPNDPDAKDAAQRYICCALSAMDFNAALDYLPTYAKRYPDGISAVFSSQIYRWKFKIPDAIKAIQKALDEMPAASTRAYELTIALADCYTATENWDKAAFCLASLPKSYQDTSASWNAIQAKCLWGRDEDQKAVESLNRAISLGGGNDLKRLLMEYYRGIADWEDMLRQAQLLQKDWPENTGEWRLNEGWAYLDMGQYEKAVPVFQDAIKRFPDQRWVVRGAQVSLAECLYRLGKKDEALDGLRDYYKSRSELRPEYLYLYGQVMYFAAKDYAEAEKYMRQVVREYPGDPMVYQAKQFLPLTLEMQGNWKDASDRLKAAADAVPAWSTWTKARDLKTAADGYFQGKLYKEAADTYEQAMKMQGISKDVKASLMYKLGLCEKELGHGQLAVTYLQRIVTDFPKTKVYDRARETLSVWEVVE